ncbi:MAG: hypothetical protein APR54_08090 [Candidatus Cloacimonas sp. SDB]|nr:MAG: hypothetical protein APR54_08090 [Candidatus Cloacimonas sp. SDB]
MNRILQIKNIKDAEAELKKINVSSGGVAAMASKAMVLAIKLTGVKLGAANILKQEMLSLGGDAAVARGVVEGKIPVSDVILLGDRKRIKKLIAKLEHQSIFGLTAIKYDLERLISLYFDEQKILKMNQKEILLNEVKIIGILNVTPDSFSDGNEYLDPEAAFARAEEMINEGVDIIDIGGESTRPGAEGVSVDEELRRVIPVIKQIRANYDIPISIDTTKSAVAEAALQTGADLINDVSALRFDEKMIQILQKNEKIPVILMHMQGKPRTMQKAPQYQDVIEEILEFFDERINVCLNAGISLDRILIDPGIGFGKRQQDNLEILKKISEFKCLGRPVVLGASRKSFINRIYESEAFERLEGSLATSALAFHQGIDLVRVHDVKAHKRLIKTLSAIG